MDSVAAQAKRLGTGVLELAKRYQELIVRDPELAGRLESGFRLASYLVPGLVGGSWAVTEASYSAANLYCLLNDYLVTRKCPSASPLHRVPRGQRVVLWLLAVLECTEVMLEVTSELAVGEPGKWAVVILLQCVKATLRGILVFYMKSGLLTTPAVPSPDRKHAKEAQSLPQLGEGQPLAWRAPRTGRVVRSIHTDPSIPFSQLQGSVTPSPLPSSSSRSLSTRQLAAEALYISRPLLHLASMFSFSQGSWKPWLLSMTLDLASLQLHGGLLRWRSKENKSEIVRRRVSLLLYLLRTPFYDRYTRDLLVRLLSYLAATIPLVRVVVNPMLGYLPSWQKTYSYCWS
ncbi:Peroxisomal membrane protein PEX16 [Geodia barretti]|uniref:Peroxisomal membrane protein PEX16 n=1 Tax=Geodia barretti TaxID=519541 RepID=A0AA35RT36_GEOBA|nr:Peroxisomal membrane protein PEX16 [Geodia barretti]